MKIPHLYPWVIAALVSSVFSSVPLSSIDKNSTLGRYVPNEYVIEIADFQNLRRRTLGSLHQDVYREMRTRGVNVDVKKEYDVPGIFTGASMTLSTPEDVARVNGIPGVQAIRPVMKIPPPEPIDMFIVDDPNDPRLPDSLSTHVMTGVDKLHEEGLSGKGIKIGIIDTGVDYTHPALGGAIGPGHKIIGGYDFVGDAYNGANTPQPDNDPLDQCAGHGTHVAGIIGANPNNPFGIVGVANGASLAAYRIFGCTGSTTDDVIIDALLQGYKDKMDILTLSLGGVDGWTEGTGSVVASRIAETGIVVTTAAGNDGAYGSWYTSSPGNGISVISVASVDNTVIPIQNVTVKGVDHNPIPYLEAVPFNVTGDLPIYATSTNTSITDDACNPLPSNTPDLSGYVVILHRGTCAFTQKLANAAAKGGKIFLIYNFDTGAWDSIAVGNYTAALISAEDGKYLVEQFAANAPIALNFPQTGGQYNFPNTHGGLVSSFSSYGPTFDMYFKPAVAAPGGNILSTIPVSLGSYAVESGTSMATPFTAGAAALILWSRGRSAEVGLAVRDLLQTTASPILSENTEGSLLQTATQQGAGLIQVNRAVHTTTRVTPGQLLLNDTANFRSSQTITITNSGREKVRYQLEHVAAGTAMTIRDASIFASLGPVPLTNATARVRIRPKCLVVGPGESKNVSISFTAPTVDTSSLPVFSGFINIVGANETLHVTYLGAAAALKDRTIIDDTDSYFGVTLPVILGGAGNVQTDPTNYTLVGGDIPTAVFRMAFGSPALSFDLVDKDTTVENPIPRRGLLLFSGLFEPAEKTFQTIGSLAEVAYVPRNSDASDAADNGYSALSILGTFANNSQIPNGQYRVLMRALRVAGDPSNERDYESWLSPIIGIDATSP
ncbi:pyrolysin [Desarmillaria tabescens]|uniref:Pyrolysin n=1 Tax=Armillaria tabescens TaxID=1929756 RepID=A0AA39JAV0_ARMTA|nr:pyrolysin [Desarmillaria tabescens]KAK0437979.1 pyrolysin [Desarmillaria tabescens]